MRRGRGLGGWGDCARGGGLKLGQEGIAGGLRMIGPQLDRYWAAESGFVGTFFDSDLSVKVAFASSMNLSLSSGTIASAF